MIEVGTSERNRVDKILQDANVKLSSALSDIFGVSGQLMLEALLEGKAQPAEIAQFAQRRAQRKIPQIVAALEGHRMSNHHRQMIRYKPGTSAFPGRAHRGAGSTDRGENRSTRL